MYDFSSSPVVAEADVVVCGAGPGGMGAAYLAGKSGLSVAVIESAGRPGGMAAIAEVMPFMSSALDNEPIDAPVYARWVKAIYSYQSDSVKARIDASHGTEYPRRTFTAAVASLAAEDLFLEAGAKMLYHHTLIDCIKDGNRIEAVVVHSKSGFGLVKGKMFVDCTGDGDLAARAGAPFERGDAEGFCQPMTTCFKLANLNFPYDSIRTPEFARFYQQKHKEAQERGELSCVRENLLTFPTMYKDTVHFNTTRVCGYDATNGVELAEAEIIGRKQVREYLKWMRNELPGFEDAELTNMGDIGVRESRRVLGQYYLTADELAGCRKFPDAIARCTYPVDIHNPRGTGTVLKVIPPGDYYEVPYGCIVPQKIENLTIGGRSISADIAAHSSLRIMPTVCSIGQAAGIAAALAIKNNTVPGKLDGRLVREELKKSGADL